MFISSVISGFEPYRDTAARAAKDLGLEVIRAEDFGATASSPQQACLDGVRKADMTVLLLGKRYGAKQRSGLSATHEEYREARERHSVLAFVQQNVDPEAAQTEFIQEVQGWETGHLTTDFTTKDELRSAVTRGLHDYAVSTASGSVNEQDLLALAEEGVEESDNSSFFSVGRDPEVVLSLATGPRQEVVRPSVLEADSFARQLQQEALFGTHSLFAVEAGALTELREDWLVLSQERASVNLNSTGDVVIRQAAVAADSGVFESPALIEEDITSHLTRALQFSAAILDRIDSTKRVAHIAIVAALTGVRYRTWRTRVRSPRSGDIEVSQNGAVVHLNPGVRPRTAIGQLADELAQDLTVLLRRELRE